MDTLPPNTADWPPRWRVIYEERAAIMEYDGVLPRQEAEQKAEQCVREQHRSWHR